MTNQTITATKAKTQFAELIDLARKEPVTITRNNRPVAVVLSPEEYQALEKLDDQYWIKQADKVGKEDALSAQESQQFIDQILHASA
jgi:prevent-host-death family protein